MNNSGKTSFLKALQLALGNRQFLSQDDFYIQGNEKAEKITIDLLVILAELLLAELDDTLNWYETQ